MANIIKSGLEFDLMEVFVKHSLLPESQLRNAKIRYEFEQLKETGISVKQAKEELADKYFLGIKSIENIIYINSKRKNVLE
jgi:hypothetical protein